MPTRYLTLVCLLVLVVGCAAELERLGQKAAQEPTSENYLALGVEQMKAKRYEAAVASFKEAVKLDPSSSRAHHNLGVAYVRMGFNREALEEFRLANKLKPDYQKLLLPLNPPGSPADGRSIEELRQAASSDSGDLQAAFALAEGYHRAALLDEAVAQYRAVVARSPKHAGAHYGLGTALARQGRYTEALSSLQEAVRLKPAWATPHYTLGLVYLIQGDVEDAFREYQVLHQLDAPLAESLFAKIYE